MWYSKSKSASASKSFKKEPLQKGQYRFLRDENIFAMCFHDKKEIYFLPLYIQWRKFRVENQVRTEGQ